MDRLQTAFHRLIQRHESLRTGFEMIRGEPMQMVKPEVEFTIERYKATAEEVEELFRTFVRPFDLSQAPLLRVGLIELEQEKHIFMFDMHHIVTDGASMNIFIEELIQLYDGKELAPLRIQYKDFTAWQQQAEQKERIKKQEDYWLDVFHEALPSFELPKDFARPQVRSFEGKRYNFVLNESVVQGVKQLEELTGSTTYMILFAAYTILLAKYSGQEDIVVGTPVAGRVHDDLQHIIGMFVNTLAIRTAPAGEKTFKDYVTETKETMLKAYENQEYPFEELVEKLGVQRDLSRNPLFDTMFVLQNTEQTDIEIDSLAVRPYEETHAVAKFDLQLTFEMHQHEIQGSFDYCTKLFKKENHRYAGTGLRDDPVSGYTKLINSIKRDSIKRESKQKGTLCKRNRIRFLKTVGSRCPHHVDHAGTAVSRLRSKNLNLLEGFKCQNLNNRNCSGATCSTRKIVSLHSLRFTCRTQH